jgi:hypothetical protein
MKTKTNHYEATKELKEHDCLEYCTKLANDDIKTFAGLTFDKEKLVKGYMKLYYTGKK